MSNGHACCVLEVCCPPRSERQKKALAAEMMKAFGWDDEMTSYQVDPLTLAAWIVNNYDLAPAGSLSAFKGTIARLARESPPGGAS